ncbi:immunoglobulin superfamily member 1-like isoform 3-T3 [Anomaloglossus baeobatrachus]|uniref:immunoglobulin superfamily member 1-like isoform X3 n=1 Tax=Anomaloglossus baeobatrachus TaxID=238106 RepID=UPI003F503317
MFGTINLFLVFFIRNTAMAQTEVPRPILLFEPEQPVYITGDSLSMRCFVDMQTRITGYNFFKDSKMISNNSASSRMTLPPLYMMDAGNYFCTYNTEVSSRVPESNAITLRVLDPPPAPALSFEPQRNVFVVNQSLVIRCHLPGEQQATEVYLYKNEMIVRGADNFGGLFLENTERRNTGNYTCRYKVDISGRTVDSRPSDTKPLVVIDLPQTPVLRYGNNIQNQSRQVEIVCEIPNPSFSIIHGYRLYRNGGEIFSVRQQNQFVINYNLEFDGCYSCRSFVDILGEEILSPKSAEVFLTLEASNRRVCEMQNSSSEYGLSTQGFKLYGSVLIGKLIVLITILLIFGIHLLVVRLRSKTPETQEQSLNRL